MKILAKQSPLYSSCLACKLEECYNEEVKSFTIHVSFYPESLNFLSLLNYFFYTLMLHANNNKIFASYWSQGSFPFLPPSPTDKIIISPLADMLR